MQERVTLSPVVESLVIRLYRKIWIRDHGLGIKYYIMSARAKDMTRMSSLLLLANKTP